MNLNLMKIYNFDVKHFLVFVWCVVCVIYKEIYDPIWEWHISQLSKAFSRRVGINSWQALTQIIAESMFYKNNILSPPSLLINYNRGKNCEHKKLKENLW